MKCFQCKQQIINELAAILISVDGDFVCSEKCNKKFKKDRGKFFANIGEDSCIRK